MILRLSLLQPNEKPSIPTLVNFDNVTEVYEMFKEDGEFQHTNIVYNCMGGEQPLFTSVEQRLEDIIRVLGKAGGLANLRKED